MPEATRPAPLKATVVLCTLNRAQMLRRALAALQEQDLPATDFEVLVVDNGSSDETRTVVAEVASLCPNVRYFCEPSLGLSRARNLGLGQARGEIVAFIDDDAVADRSWIRQLLAGFQAESCRPLCVGGKSIPLWDGGRPSWLPASLQSFYSVLDYGAVPRKCRWPAEVLVGCNMAFSRTQLQAWGGFDPGLGRRGGLLYGNEEIAVQKRIVEAGGALLYQPAAVVHHHVLPERVSRRWLISRVFYQGRSDPLASRRSTSASGLSRLPFAHARAILKEQRHSPSLMVALCAAAYFGGFCFEAAVRLASHAGLRRRSPRPPG